MSRIRILLASLLVAASPAVAQQPAERPKPTPLEEARAAFHDLIGVCIEARARGVRVQELPTEFKDSVKLSPWPVVRPVGQDSSFVTDWQTGRSWGVSLRNIAPGCEVAMTPSPGYLEAFDASVEAKSAADILISKLPGLTERRFFPGKNAARPAEIPVSGRRFIQAGAQGLIPSYVATYPNGAVTVVLGFPPRSDSYFNSRYRPLENCARTLRNEETWAVSSGVRDKPAPGASPVPGYTFFWFRPPGDQQPSQAIGENPADRQSCAFIDSRLTIDEAKTIFPAEQDGILFTVSPVKGGGVVVLARLDPAQLTP